MGSGKGAAADGAAGRWMGTARWTRGWLVPLAAEEAGGFCAGVTVGGGGEVRPVAKS